MPVLLLVIILGIVEGVTEYLPVSSTGHLILAGEWLGWTDARARTFEIFIQLGAILAIVWLYRGRLTDALLDAGGVGREAHRARCAQGLGLDRGHHFQPQCLGRRKRPQEVLEAVPEGQHRRGDPLLGERREDPLDHGHLGDGQHLLGHAEGEGSEACP